MVSRCKSHDHAEARMVACPLRVPSEGFLGPHGWPNRGREACPGHWGSIGGGSLFAASHPYLPQDSAFPRPAGRLRRSQAYRQTLAPFSSQPYNHFKLFLLLCRPFPSLHPSPRNLPTDLELVGCCDDPPDGGVLHSTGTEASSWKMNSGP